MATNSTSLADSPLAYQLELYHEDRGPSLMAGCIVSIAFATVSILLRYWAQARIGKLFTWDSWLITIATLFALATTAGTVIAINLGLGKHQLRVLQEDPNPPLRSVEIFKIGYIITITQGLALMFTKLSILLFYRRIFTTGTKIMKWAIWGWFGISTGLGIGATIEFILACNPPRMFWLRVYLILGFEPPEPVVGVCLPQTAHLAVPMMVDLVSEVALLCIPAIALWNLQLPRKKKIGLFFAFSLGIFVTAISIVRFIYAFQISNHGDLSWDNSSTYIWTCVQVCFGVVAACIPAMAPLYRLGKSSVTAKTGYLSKVSKNESRPSRFVFLGRDKSALDTSSSQEITSPRNNYHHHYRGSDKNSSTYDEEDPERGWEAPGNYYSSIRGPTEGNQGHIPLDNLNIQVSRDVTVDFGART